MLRICAPILTAVALTASACDVIRPPIDPPIQACTEIGCESAVAFHLGVDLVNGVEYLLEACVDDDCSSETVTVPDGPGGVVGTRVGRFDVATDADRVNFLIPDGDYSGAHDVFLRVTAADGSLTAEIEALTVFEQSRPNGPGCPPVCWFAEVFA